MDSVFAISIGLVLLITATAATDCNCTNNVVFCYYNADANTRNSSGAFGVSDLPTDLCTHILYSFIGLTADGEITLSSTQQTVNNKSNTIEDFAALKSTANSTKYMVSLGGWNSQSDNFTIVCNDDTLRATFVSNAVSFLDEYGLDGLDIDWEYPAQNGGADTDKEAFSSLLKELKAAFNSSGYLLTAAVAVTQSNIDTSYNVTALNEYLDYINLMTYEYHGTWDDVTGTNAPLYAQLTDSNTTNLNVNSSVYTWIENGANRTKLVLGLASYGKTFTLSSATNNATGANFTGAGEAGPYTDSAGTWAFYEICQDQNASTEWNVTQVSSSYVYASKDTFWVGYDNNDTIYTKARYASMMGLAGIMYWSVDNDDFAALCGYAYPLINQGIDGYNSAIYVVSDADSVYDYDYEYDETNSTDTSNSTTTEYSDTDY